MLLGLAGIGAVARRPYHLNRGKRRAFRDVRARRCSTLRAAQPGRFRDAAFPRATRPG